MRFYFFAKTQHENLGDRGIAFALLNLFKDYGDVFVNVSGCPRDYVDEIAGQNFNVSNLGKYKQIFEIVKSSFCGEKVAILMKPGHFYGDDGGVIGRFAQLTSLFLLRLFGVRIYRFGSSVGPFDKKIEKIEFFASKLYISYTVRENFSMDYCKSIGIKNVEYFPDLAFVLPKVFHGSSGFKKSEEKYFEYLFSFRRPKNSENVYKNIIKNICSDNIKNTICVTQVARDIDFNTELSEFAGVNSIKHVVYERDGVESVFECYSDSRVVLSNRLHVLLFAGAKGALPIPVVSSRENKKIIGIYEAMGLDYLVVDVDRGADACVDKIKKIKNEYEKNTSIFLNEFNKNAETIKKYIYDKFH